MSKPKYKTYPLEANNLMDYLKQNDALSCREKRQLYKHKYRKAYQKRWAENRRESQTQISFYVKNKAYKTISRISKENGLSPSELARELLLSHSSETKHIHNKQTLETLLKQLGLLINEHLRQKPKTKFTESTLDRLLFLESILLDYLNPR